MWIAAHVVLVVAALGLLAVGITIAQVIGSGGGMWGGLAALVIGQSLLLAVLAIDLTGASVEVDLIRTLDTWDSLGVVGIVVLLLELRRRRPEWGRGATLALLVLAVPAVEGLVVVAAVAVVIGFGALAHALATDRWRVAPTWLVWATVAAYALAAVVSWPRGALHVVVLAWTVHHQWWRVTPPADR